MPENETNTIHDPANYRAMSEPFESYEVATSAMADFFEEVREARQRHRIGDVHFGIRITYGPTEIPLVITAHIGDELKESVMAHYALAVCEANDRKRVERIRKMVSRGKE